MYRSLWQWGLSWTTTSCTSQHPGYQNALNFLLSVAAEKIAELCSVAHETGRDLQLWRHVPTTTLIIQMPWTSSYLPSIMPVRHSRVDSRRMNSHRSKMSPFPLSTTRFAPRFNTPVLINDRATPQPFQNLTCLHKIARYITRLHKLRLTTRLSVTSSPASAYVNPSEMSSFKLPLFWQAGAPDESRGYPPQHQPLDNRPIE